MSGSALLLLGLSELHPQSPRARAVREMQSRYGIAWLVSAVLPMRSDVRAGPVEVHMLVDVVDPGHGNVVMMRPVGRTLFGQLDLVAALEAINLSDGFPIGRNNVHMLLDQRTIRHSSSPET
jgi:hypothetical protein